MIPWRLRWLHNRFCRNHHPHRIATTATHESVEDSALRLLDRLFSLYLFICFVFTFAMWVDVSKFLFFIYRYKYDTIVLYESCTKFSFIQKCNGTVEGKQNYKIIVILQSCLLNTFKWSLISPRRAHTVLCVSREQLAFNNCFSCASKIYTIAVTSSGNSTHFADHDVLLVASWVECIYMLR